MKEFIQSHFTQTALIKVGVTIAVGLVLLYFLRFIMHKYFEKRISHQSRIIFSKVISFLVFVVMAIAITSQLGFNSLFTTVLGTAGIAGIAIGFASKTSLENIISGVLLLSDKSFKIDDIIIVDDIEGNVEAIDFLSVKIRTYDNQIVRVPNVKVLSSNVVNLYPNEDRRRDFYFKVTYDTDLVKLEQVLQKIAEDNPHVIRQEDTYVKVESFENIGYKIKYGVWFRKGNYTVVTNAITKDIALNFKSAKIEIPVSPLSIETS